MVIKDKAGNEVSGGCLKYSPGKYPLNTISFTNKSDFHVQEGISRLNNIRHAMSVCFVADETDQKTSLRRLKTETFD